MLSGGFTGWRRGLTDEVVSCLYRCFSSLFVPPAAVTSRVTAVTGHVTGSCGFKGHSTVFMEDKRTVSQLLSFSFFPLFLLKTV